MHKSMFRYFLASAIFFAAIPVFAGIEVSPILIDIQGSNITKQDVRVTNLDNETAYVKVTPYLMNNPGLISEKLISISNPQKLGLLVSPRMMVIPPKQSRNVRMVFLDGNPEADRVYQVDVEPVVGKMNFEPSQNKEVGVKVLIAYGIIVIHRPENIRINYQLVREGNKLVLKNIGNSNFIAMAGQQCDTNGKDCQDLTTKRLYAGQSIAQKLKYTTPVKYVLTYLDKSVNITSN
jgi:P pilus assembly chaperone PapD